MYKDKIVIEDTGMKNNLVSVYLFDNRIISSAIEVIPLSKANKMYDIVGRIEEGEVKLYDSSDDYLEDSSYFPPEEDDLDD